MSCWCYLIGVMLVCFAGVVLGVVVVFVVFVDVWMALVGWRCRAPSVVMFLVVVLVVLGEAVVLYLS